MVELLLMWNGFNAGLQPLPEPPLGQGGLSGHVIKSLLPSTHAQMERGT